MHINEKYNSYVIIGDTAAIIIESGPEWGPDTWREVKYYGKFSEERIRSCFYQLLQELRVKCNDSSFGSKETGTLSVWCEWEDKRDCFERVKLGLYWMSKSQLELNISMDSRPVMRTKSGGWYGLTECSLRKLERKKMLAWINGEEIVDECTKMISDRVKEQYIE